MMLGYLFCHTAALDIIKSLVLLTADLDSHEMSAVNSVEGERLDTMSYSKWYLSAVVALL